MAGGDRHFVVGVATLAATTLDGDDGVVYETGTSGFHVIMGADVAPR